MATKMVAAWSADDVIVWVKVVPKRTAVAHWCLDNQSESHHQSQMMVPVNGVISLVGCKNYFIFMAVKLMIEQLFNSDWSVLVVFDPSSVKKSLFRLFKAS